MLKKIFVFITILSLLTGYFPVAAFAQTATDSAQANGSSSADMVQSLVSTSSSSLSSPFSDSFVSSSVVPSQNPIVNPLLISPSFDSVSPGTPNFSTGITKKWSIGGVIKHDYKGDEAYQTVLDNISPQNINVKVFDDKGDKVTVNLQKTDTGNGTAFQILPPRDFRPGKYTVQFTDSNGNTQTQDFTWGVLAINTDKSIYLPNENANLSMAVLDDSGNMVCDASVTLVITNPDGSTSTLSTSNGLIAVNPDCKIHAYTQNPDYEANYQVGGAGTYNMALTANIPQGSRTISDSFTVQNSVSFDVQRITGTRIFPPAAYPVNFNIKVNKDFNGQIIDYVPSSFTILPSTGSAAVPFDVKQIAAPVSNTNGNFSSIHLALPFNGNHIETLGFGQQLLDPQEKDLYAQFGLSGHDGLDFAMPIGTPVLAADDGTVVMAGGVIYGTTIVIQHSWGRSYYGHLSKVEVKLGQNITKGEEIGLSGNSGITTGPHLHFGIKLNQNDSGNGYYGKVDPSFYLGITPVQNTPSSINDTVKAIVWNINVKKGDTLNLSYSFKAPDVSPMFYTLGPLSFYDPDKNLIFQEARQWQLAIDVVFPATSYLSSTADTLLTASAWQIVTAQPASGNTTTSVTHSNKNAGYYQWKPGVAGNSTNAGTTAPTTPSGTGFLYETSLNSTIPTGTWQFTIQTNTSATVNSTEVPTVCVWEVSISAGAITSPVSIIPCTDGATSISTAGTTTQTISVSGVAAVSFTSSQYLYVEYWEHQNPAGSGKTVSTTITFQANAGANNKIVTPGASSNLSPAAPSQDSPLNSATGVSTSPTFLMTSASDAESNNIQYKATIYSNSACTTAVQTNDESASQTGWTGQNATCTSGLDCYTPGTQGSFLTQTALSNSTQYWWKASAKDPLGSNAFTDSSTCNTFTTQSAGPTLDQLLRHGEWFNSGVRQPFTF